MGSLGHQELISYASPVLCEAAVCTAIFLALASALLVCLGHRLRCGNPLLSALLAFGLAAASCWLAGTLTAEAPPLIRSV